VRLCTITTINNISGYPLTLYSYTPNNAVITNHELLNATIPTGRALAGPAFWVWQAGGIPELSSTWPRLLWLALLVPVVEELAFRGVVQCWLAERYPRRWWEQRLSLANLLFAAAHVGIAGHWSALPVFAPSLVFGYFRDKYQRATPAVALHSFYNAGFFMTQGG
jgi:membrane protease YdiL (CAAX protease family)